jgi:hypothetical protein
VTQVPAQLGDFKYTGLDDFAVTDSVLPRIKILHEEGVWTDNLSNVKMPVLRFIPLGLVKGRVLFHHQVDNNDVPMCKSSDFNIGYPNPDAPRTKSFPWDLAGLDPRNFPADAEGNTKLPCASCHLKDWGTDPKGDSPYCSEQWNLPIYYDPTAGAQGNPQTDFVPAILTLQKSSLKPLKAFFSSFAQSNRPPFLVIATSTLKMQDRGSVTFSKPSFTTESESPRERWQEFAEQYEEMKIFLQRPPTRDDDAPATPPAAAQQANTWGGPQQPPPAAADPWAQAAQPQPIPGDPWAQQQPAQQAPPPQAPPAQEPWAQPAAAQQAPVQPQQPPQEPWAQPTQPAWGPPPGQVVPGQVVQQEPWAQPPVQQAPEPVAQQPVAPPAQQEPWAQPAAQAPPAQPAPWDQPTQPVQPQQQVPVEPQPVAVQPPPVQAPVTEQPVQATPPAAPEQPQAQQPPTGQGLPF